MSVIVIDDGAINRAFNTIKNLAWDAPNNWPGVWHQVEQLRTFNEIGFCHRWPEKYHFKGFDYLARWSAIFNLKNYRQRYRHHGEFYRVTFKISRDKSYPVTRGTIAQTVKTLECLKYNTIDHYEDCTQLKALGWLIDQLRMILLDSSPEMLSAEWGSMEPLEPANDPVYDPSKSPKRSN